MRNKVTTLIILVSIAVLLIAALRGISIGRLQILSISSLQEKNSELNDKINDASELTAIDYPNNIETLEETYDKYEIQKQKYEELSDIAGQDGENAYESKQYDIGYLWKIFGKYATSRNLNIGMDVQKNNGGNDNYYDLNFTVSGQYVNISQFITDIENNSDLYFRIYNFKMSGSGETITSTFTVKDVNIDPSTITTVTTNTTDTQTGE